MNIYEPAEDSHLLQKHINRYADGRVLDVGTGSGIQAFTAIESSNVREVVAIDINEEAVDNVNEKVQQQKLRKIKAIKSDLFSNVHGKFNLIIFNPPYLPQDQGIEDPALYGGKKGWEIAERFFQDASNFLFHDGKILFLFSSLTNKKKIEDIIHHYLLEFQEVAKQKLSFEELYVYVIEKSDLLRTLEAQGVHSISYFTHGKRGDIFTGMMDKSILIKSHFATKKVVKVAIKVKREASLAEGRIQNEIHWLKKLNKENIGPKLLFYGDNFLAYEFVEGEFILDWIHNNKKEDIKKVLSNLLQQCFILDELKVNKEEMHHPLKHIVINTLQQPTLLDFERCTLTEKPHNVTQFVECICRMKKELQEKGFSIDVVAFRTLANNYKKEISKKNFEMVIKELA